MLVAELLVLVEAVSLEEQLEVLLGDDVGADAGEARSHVLVGVETLAVAPGFVEVHETAYLEHGDAVALGHGDVEVAHHEVGEVIAGNLEEQLVVVHRAVLVSQHEDERHGTLFAEGLDGGGVNGSSLGSSAHQTALPDAAQRARRQQTSLAHALGDKAGKFADFVLRILAANLLESVEEIGGVALLQTAHGVEEHELRTVSAQCVLAGREAVVQIDLAVTPVVVGVVGGRIKGVLAVLAVEGVVGIVGVAHNDGVVAVGELLDELVLVKRGQLGFLPTRVHQVEVVIDEVHAAVVGVLLYQALERLFSQAEVLELVLVDDAGVEERLLEDVVRLHLLLVAERNLLIVVHPVVDVGDDAVGSCHARAVRCQAVGRQFVVVVVVHLFECRVCQHALVGAPPVVLQLAPAPFLLEVLLSLRHELRVVEVPRVVAACHLRGVHLGKVGTGIAERLLATVHACLLFGLLLFLLLFLLYLFDNLVNDGVNLLLGQRGKVLQAVLEFNRLGMLHQLVEDGRAFVELRIVLAVLVDEADSLAVAALGVGVLGAFPVDVAQVKQEDALLHTVAGALFGPFLVVGDGLEGILLR